MQGGQEYAGGKKYKTLLQGVLQVYKVYRVFKGTQGVLEYTGYIRVYRVYCSIEGTGMQGYTWCTRVYRV